MDDLQRENKSREPGQPVATMQEMQISQHVFARVKAS
jgi:hypothetical protein